MNSYTARAAFIVAFRCNGGQYAYYNRYDPEEEHDIEDRCPNEFQLIVALEYLGVLHDH